jgi:hypothetical protein
MATGAAKGDSSGRRNGSEWEVVMNRQKRRSDLTGRAPLPSPGRPPVAGREERGRFWAEIAAGLSSEDAAAAANVPQAIGARWFRSAGGMPPAMFGPSAKPLSADISHLLSAKRSRCCGRKAALCRRWRAGSGEPHQPFPASCAQHRHSRWRPGVSRDDRTVARRAIGSSAKTGEACAQSGLTHLRARAPRRNGRRSKRGSSSWSDRVMERAASGTAAGPPMGARLDGRESGS